MRIAIILNNLRPTGTNITTTDFARELISTYKVKIDFFSFTHRSKDDLELENVKKIHFFSNIVLSDYSHVYSCTLYSDFFSFSRMLFLRGKNRPIFIMGIHNVIPEDLGFTYGWFISKIVSPIWLWIKFKSDIVIVGSNTLLTYYSRFANSNKINVIEYGRSKEPYIPFCMPSSDVVILDKMRLKYKLVGTVGNLSKRKNYQLTIDLLKSDSKIAWVCLGEGEDLEFLQELVRENELMERVFFVGFRADSRPYYKYFDIFFHPSFSEGFPLVIIDAMASRTPILVPRLDVYGSILKCDMVFYYDQSSNVSLLRGLGDILNNLDLVEQKTKNSFVYYKDNLSVEAYGNKYFQLLNSN